MHSSAWVMGHLKVELNDRVAAKIPPSRTKKKQFLRFQGSSVRKCHEATIRAPTTLPLTAG